MSDSTATGGPWTRPRTILIGILLIGLVIRVALLLGTSDYRPAFDSLDFSLHATSIANGDGYPETKLAGAGGPSAFRPPAYPYMLGAVYAVGGDSVTAGRIFGGLLSLLVVLLIYLIGKELWGTREGLAAAAIAAVFPPLAAWHTALLTEPLFLALEMAIILVLLKARKATPERLTGLAIAAGALAAVAALTRSNGMLLFVVVGIGLWSASMPTAQTRFRNLALAAVAATLVMAPWVIRNAVEFDKFIPTTTQGGYGLAGTYNDRARNDPQFPASWLAPQFQGEYVPLFERRDLDEAELDSLLRERSIDYIADNPGFVAEATVRNSLRMLGVSSERNEASLASGGSTLSSGLIRTADLSTWLLFGLAAAGIWMVATMPRYRVPAVLWLTPVLLVFPALPISGGARYRAPADPFLVLVGALALLALIGFARSRMTDSKQPLGES